MRSFSRCWGHAGLRMMIILVSEVRENTKKELFCRVESIGVGKAGAVFNEVAGLLCGAGLLPPLPFVVVIWFGI